MGITYTAVCVFGIEYSYDEAKVIKKVSTAVGESEIEKLKHLLDEIQESPFWSEEDDGSDGSVTEDESVDDIYLNEMWMDLGKYFMVANDGYYDEVDQMDLRYILGINMVGVDPAKCDWVEMTKKMKELCEKYKLKYSRPLMVCNVFAH